MKHIIPLTICTIAAAACAVAAVSAHHAYVHHLDVQNAHIAAVQAAERAQAELDAQKQAEATQAKLATNEKGCQAGIAAYDLLTPSQKAVMLKNGISKPVCAL